MQFISPDAEETKCPFCGLVVYIDEAQSSIHHEAPACEAYEAFVAKHEGTRSITVKREAGQA